MTRGECFYQSVSKENQERSKNSTPQIVFTSNENPENASKKFTQSLLKPTKTQICKKQFLKIWVNNIFNIASASNIRKKYRPHTMIELEVYKNENDPMNMNYLKSPVYIFD